MTRVRGAVAVSSVLSPMIGLSLGALALAGCNKSAVDAQKLAKHAQMIEGEDPKAAIEEFKTASAMDPANHQILAALGTLYEKQKDWPNAADTWLKASSVDETFASYSFRRGHALFEAAQKDAAHAGYDKVADPMSKAIKADKNYSDAYYYTGIADYELDDEQGALEAYTHAIETNPAHLEYFVRLSNLYLDLGYAEEGLQVALEGQKQRDNVKAKGDNEQAEVAQNFYNLIVDEARADQLLGKIDDEIKAFEKARTVPNPKNASRESEYHLALGYWEKNQALDACEALGRYLKSPQGKSQESTENRADAGVKKSVWQCKGI